MRYIYQSYQDHRYKESLCISIGNSKTSYTSEVIGGLGNMKYVSYAYLGIS